MGRGDTAIACWSQNTKLPEQRFYAVVGDGAREVRDLARSRLAGALSTPTDLSPLETWRCRAGRRGQRPSRQVPAPCSGYSPIREGRRLSRRELQVSR